MKKLLSGAFLLCGLATYLLALSSLGGVLLGYSDPGHGPGVFIGLLFFGGGGLIAIGIGWLIAWLGGLAWRRAFGWIFLSGLILTGLVCLTLMTPHGVDVVRHSPAAKYPGTEKDIEVEGAKVSIGTDARTGKPARFIVEYDIRAVKTARAAIRGTLLWVPSSGISKTDHSLSMEAANAVPTSTVPYFYTDFQVFEKGATYHFRSEVVPLFLNKKLQDVNIKTCLPFTNEGTALVPLDEPAAQAWIARLKSDASAKYELTILDHRWSFELIPLRELYDAHCGSATTPSGP